MTYDKEAKSIFNVASWTEAVVEDIDGTGQEMNGTYYPDRGVTRASVRYTYTGDIEGEGAVEYLMTYKPGDAPVVALERFTGSIGGHEGTCILLHRGTHDAGSVTDSLEVVEGMGTGALETLRGIGAPIVEGHSDSGYRLTLTYSI